MSARITKCRHVGKDWWCPPLSRSTEGGIGFVFPTHVVHNREAYKYMLCVNKKKRSTSDRGKKKKDKRFIEKATMQRLSFYFEDRSFPRPWQNDEHFLHAMPFSVSEEQRTSDLSSGAPTTKWVVSSAFVSSPLAPILRVCVRVCVLVWKCSTRSRFR